MTKVTKVTVVFWNLLAAIKKEDPEIYVAFGSYELLVSNVAQQMKKKNKAKAISAELLL